MYVGIKTREKPPTTTENCTIQRYMYLELARTVLASLPFLRLETIICSQQTQDGESFHACSLILMI